MSKLLLIEPRTCYCAHCRQPMELACTIPTLSPASPALLAFYCLACNELATIEDEFTPQNRQSNPGRGKQKAPQPKPAAGASNFRDTVTRRTSSRGRSGSVSPL